MIGTIPQQKTKHIAHFSPLPWQVQPWRDKSRVMLLTGSAGGGKSRLAAEKLHGFCLKYPGAMALMLRKTRSSMTNSTTLFMDRRVMGPDPKVLHRPSKNRFEYTNGSILVYGGMANEEQREQVRSIGQDGGLDICWLEEANRFQENDYQEVFPRMRGKAAPWVQILLSTNPDHPYHWINTRLIQGSEASTYYSKAQENPHNPPAYQEMLNSLTGVLRLRLRDGKWVQAEGAVYDLFDPGLHIVDWFEPPLEWRRVRVIDFGYTNPFVCDWWAIDGDGRAYLYQQIYMTQRTVKVHSAQINRLSKAEKEKAFRAKYGPGEGRNGIQYIDRSGVMTPEGEQALAAWRYYEETACDHDAEDRATLEENGIKNTAANKPISPGIQAVTERLKVAGDGKPRLFVMRGALVERDPSLEARKLPMSTEQEFPVYAWPEGKDGKPDKEAPIDLNNHGMDTARYLTMYLDGPSKWRDIPFVSV